MITCSDDICIFPELMKRLVGHVLVKDISSVEEKVQALIPVFEPQLRSLRGVSRPTKDWIEDNVINPAFIDNTSFSMLDAMEVFGEMDLLGTSPAMFTNYSWYKDVWADEMTDYKHQFAEKRMALAMAGLPEQAFSVEQTAELVALFSDIKHLENAYEKTSEDAILHELSRQMNAGRKSVAAMDRRFGAVYEESCAMVEELVAGRTPDMNDYPQLFGAFGRGLQYMSFMKI